MEILCNLQKNIPGRKIISAFIIGAVFSGIFIGVSFITIEATSTPEFCMTCHEMKIVGEQGWEKSGHVHNSGGVVAECKDCHIPPGLVPMLWTKARDGSKDIFMHVFGESDPYKIKWDEHGRTARKKISDSSCLRCHKNLIPDGASIKMIIAHREYKRLDGQKKCLDCHTNEFHGEFKNYLEVSSE
jgi:cytochrome c nitrite reductase small subunit